MSRQRLTHRMWSAAWLALTLVVWSAWPQARGAAQAIGGEIGGQVGTEAEAEADVEADAEAPAASGTVTTQAQPPAAIPAPAAPAASSAAPAAAPAAVVPVAAPVAASSAAAEETPDKALEARELRVANTWPGPSGGIHVVDAGSGLAGTFRLQIGVDFFSSSDFLLAGDTNSYAGGSLSLSWTALPNLEIFASLSNRTNFNDQDSPRLMQVLGDSVLGLKAFADATPWLSLGGDVRVAVLNTVGDVGPVLDALSLGLRANASADLRGLEEPVPLIARLGFDYLFDNSSNLIDDIETERYAALGARRSPIDSEFRHLLRRVERFAFGVNRTDMFTLALGAEVPIDAGKDWFVHPLLEWTLGIPVNRQGYSCLLTTLNSGPADADGCLDVEGIAAMPSTLTFGARLFLPVRGLMVSAALDLGLSGTSTFVRELAPTRPYAVLLALSYAVDARERKEPPPRIQVVRDAAPAAPSLPRIRGTVVDKMNGGPVPNAIVSYSGMGFNAQQTDAQGNFLSYELEPGSVQLEVSHPDYETRTCAVDIPAPGKSAAPAPTAVAPDTDADSRDLSSPLDQGETPALNPYFGVPAKDADSIVTMRCELTAKPRVGSIRVRVTSIEGAAIAAAAVQLIGPTTLDLSTDAQGEVVQSGITAGSYQVRVEAPTYLLRQASVTFKPGETASVDIQLTPKPAEAQVELTREEVRIRKQIFFKTNSAEISETSNQLLSEIADILLRNPQVKLVEIQGHTDNRGEPALNQTLSQDRASSVRTWLIGAGIEQERLTARGYGDTRPLAPNITERNRARNRRVQFIIKEQN